uniref:U2A'/phosphoprotein 32 family A C-terminal domain-containing protein n=1 Tax=Dunaliella tertiolecta TaxID=3047 RepID=A0A7S3QKS1_DUNTE|mmetsp:Transcript_4750/g.13008  ORF Transcript_4750/g.13008 Transcript_4750/m.13008 type:complete len:411 (-) Transcript_4750:452-1684(-)|eukprot:CAMPEP_0202354300 /NCGR_PEP_ID=MMETSP1126-20121109/9682_1 /ASSEMBLY_ACC=CAM_ASM_000457 /TAXON_ID=3047 /ORGANISM="Dunaliella tertiolecta, Strain CCMP1320" /LENGTH=410 /DNA_ID=CAMNT_0048946753 /DNA_START=90 /DNA_END=1322 /DNA_ORIENTATION=+
MTSTPSPAAVPKTVISEPGKEIMGGGKNAKWVKGCVELYMGDRGIEKIRGFEPYDNLQSLWLNNNRLKKINNLDANFRIKALYVQDNQICTLKGCLLTFKFLEVLDLSNNLLRNLDKIIATLSKFKYLKNLNLTGNPCIEEPDYRMIVIYNIPSLQILDLHMVTDTERQKARMLIGGETEALTVAFQKRIPPLDSSLRSPPAYPSLEQGLAKEASTIRDKRLAEQYAQDTALFANDPFPEAPTMSNGMRTLPPNAGILSARNRATSRKSLNLGASSGVNGDFRASAYQSGRSSPGPMTGFGAPSQRSHHMGNSKAFSTFTSRSSARPAVERCIVGSSTTGSPYVAKDVLVLYHTQPGVSPLQEQSLRFSSPASLATGGSIHFEQEKYDEFLRVRTHGREKWQMHKNTVQV